MCSLLTFVTSKEPCSTVSIVQMILIRCLNTRRH
ncbi:hypothetical protein LINPERPRIM_LOCUS33007 [Linum perenne]